MLAEARFAAGALCYQCRMPHSVCLLLACLLQTAIMATADLYLTYGDALLPLTDVGGQAKPMTSMLAQV